MQKEERSGHGWDTNREDLAWFFNSLLKNVGCRVTFAHPSVSSWEPLEWGVLASTRLPTQSQVVRGSKQSLRRKRRSRAVGNWRACSLHLPRWCCPLKTDSLSSSTLFSHGQEENPEQSSSSQATSTTHPNWARAVVGPASGFQKGTRLRGNQPGRHSCEAGDLLPNRDVLYLQADVAIRIHTCGGF